MSGGRKAGLFDDRALDWVALSQTNVTSEGHHVQQVTTVSVSTRLSYAARLNTSSLSTPFIAQTYPRISIEQDDKDHQQEPQTKHPATRQTP